MTAAPARGDAYLLATALVWGLSFPAGKHVLQFMPPMAFACWRYLGAAVVLFAVLAWRGYGTPVGRHDLVRLFGLSLIGITLFQSLWANALTLTTAAKASILVNISPVFAALLASLQGSPPAPRQWAGILLSFAGVFLVVNNSLTGLTLGGGSLIGDLMFVVGAALWAMFSTWSAPLVARLGPLKVTAWVMLLGGGVLLPFGILQPWPSTPAAMPAGAWAAFAYATIVSGALGFVWWYEGIRRLGVTRAIVYSYLIPVSAIAASMALLGEHFGPLQAVGAVVVLAGIRLARGT